MPPLLPELPPEPVPVEPLPVHAEASRLNKPVRNSPTEPPWPCADVARPVGEAEPVLALSVVAFSVVALCWRALAVTRGNGAAPKSTDADTPDEVSDLGATWCPPWREPVDTGIAPLEAGWGCPIPPRRGTENPELSSVPSEP
ncbi:MAG: hypothetical protein J2P19_17515 [Pseudonocardia sp.]|nr:hypothetical protein [Pseudonocardia sp.]